jgi:hypothetical protein
MILAERQQESPNDTELESRLRRWEHIDRILQIRDVERLEALIRSDIRRFPNADSQHVEDGLQFMKDAHGDTPRELTGDLYILHPLQIALIYMTIMDPEQVTSDTINICLNHDVFEDTKKTPEMLTHTLNENVRTGVLGLSHSVNSRAKLERGAYLDQIFEIDRSSPELTLPAIKAIDTFVNGNDPRQASGLKNPLDTFFFWERLVNKKIGEMDELKRRVSPANKSLQLFLSEGKEYTYTSKDKNFTMAAFKDRLVTLRNR